MVGTQMLSLNFLCVEPFSAGSFAGKKAAKGTSRSTLMFRDPWVSARVVWIIGSDLKGS